MGKRWACDIEANNLLNEHSIDYTAIPYKLKDTFKVFCIGMVDMDSDEEVLLEGSDCCEKFKEYLKDAEMVIFHNGINYDLLALKLYAGIDYTVERDTIMGRAITIEDTMVMSKTLNPDRLGGHSLDMWGKRLKFPKTDWRAEAVELELIKSNDPKGAEFQIYHPRMGEYCLQDCRVTKRTYERLKVEWATWAWSDSYALEKKVQEIVTRQAHRGFYFDEALAKENVQKCDTKMEHARSLIEPLLPTKPITKTALKDGTPNPTPFKKDDVRTPPKNQFLKTGQPNQAIIKFVDKEGGKITGDFPNFIAVFGKEEYPLPMKKEFITKGEPDANAFKFSNKHGGDLTQNAKGDWVTTLYGKEYTLPIIGPVVPLDLPATMADQTHIKNWLIGMGWVPHSWSDKDLTLNSKKQKLTPEKFAESVQRYVDSTLPSNFCKFRCEHLKCTRQSLKRKLMGHDLSKPLKVLTNPDLTVGMEKEVCPNLRKMTEFKYAKEMSEWLTYRHRRNSILGGGVEWDNDEEMEKGYLGQDRIHHDGRISTPADTCGCNTSRFKHRVVANVPRTSSLFGAEMRAMFGCDPSTYQLGYDADSLEAAIESHYCWKYDETKEYCNSLTLPKPNDCHTSLARYLSEMLEYDFSRDASKQVKYACAYGAQPYRLSVDNGWDIDTANSVFNGYWEKAAPLAKLKTNLEKYWAETGKRKFILGIDGRKIPVRSKHSLVNALFQSAGVICMKRAMVIHEEMLIDRNLVVDFFKDDWTKKDYVQQMIAYHDEAQEEVSKSLVKFWMFTDKDEAKAFEVEGKKLGDLQEARDGRYFRAYCESGDLANKSLTQASEYYKLNVTLTAGYVIGKNWKDCH